MEILHLLCRRAFSGMTMIELMVILAIVVILSVLAYPSFISLVQNYRISGESDLLYSNLKTARAEAIKRNMSVYVSFSSGDNWCYGMNAGSACNCTISGNCGIGTHAASDTGLITLSTTGFSSGVLVFEPTHGAANASGSVIMTLFGESPFIRINIARFGSMQICSTGVSGYTAC